MCRLFSYITKTPKKCVDLLEKFKTNFSETNPDGWGTGWYIQKKAQYFKEGIPAHDPDSKFSQIANDAESEIIISHVRKLSEAPPTTENAHPFHEDNWLFIHNGSVDRQHFYPLLDPEYAQKITGETDSEVYFYWVIQNIKQHNNDVIEGVKSAVREVVKKHYTGINFVLSDGSTLYAFRYSHDPSDVYTLFKLERPPEDIAKKEIIICSEPLTDEAWEPIGFGHLLVVPDSLATYEEKIV